MRRRLARIWREFGLSITLAALFLASWALQTWTGWAEFVSEQRRDAGAA
ncbi:hypothetical protein BH24CHL9_BH24CHL9_08050 [soil metagenome]